MVSEIKPKTIGFSLETKLVFIFIIIYTVTLLGAFIFASESFNVKIARILTLTTYLVLFYFFYKKRSKIVAYIFSVIIIVSGINSILVPSVGFYTSGSSGLYLKLFYIIMGCYFIYTAIHLIILTKKQ